MQCLPSALTVSLPVSANLQLSGCSLTFPNFVPNKNEKALHGARMTTVMDLSDSSSLAWNYNINQRSPGFEDEGVEPKANTTSQSVRMTTPVNRLLLNGTISIKVLPDLKRKGKNQRPSHCRRDM